MKAVGGGAREEVGGARRRAVPSTILPTRNAGNTKVISLLF